MESNENQDQPEPLELRLAKLEELRSNLAYGTNWQVGPVRFTAGYGSMGIAQAYIVFCVLCLVAGILCTLLTSATELGVALVVGAIFAIGSIGPQAWAAQVGREISATQLVYGAELKKIIDSLHGEIRHLREQSDFGAAEMGGENDSNPQPVP
ncbi:hypothetical protein [Micromonospora sp. NRRL B-16802]|uniref:hypothetical protein n=1 Tax=Micromonospora sp. NRRL B-16802 TaxID=1415541 RepID=UPI0012FC4F24|nr:hypothetical protein [Micromonospora sp. NRRL B-16802]